MKSITEAVKIFAESVEDLDKNPISDSATVIAITNQIKKTLIPIVEERETQLNASNLNQQREMLLAFLKCYNNGDITAYGVREVDDFLKYYNK